MNLKQCFILVLSVFTPSCQLFGQIPALQFETITTQEGLPSSTVLSITQDHQGFMWFGTRFCPVRYDGVNFRSFVSQETNLVSGIDVDHSNNIWLASDPNGIFKIEDETKEMKQVDRNGKKETGFFFIDSHNRGWFSDFDGVNRIDLKTYKSKHYALRQTTYAWAKASFVEDSSGTVWVVGRDNGLFRYDSSNDKLICEWGPDCADVSRRQEVVLAKACADKDGFLWIASVSDGLIRYNTKDGTHRKFHAGRDNPSMFSIAEGIDEFGKRIFWIGHQDGLGIFRPEQEKFYYFKDIFPVTYEVNDIYRSKKDGIVWAGTSEGIIKYNPKSNFFQSISLPAGIVGSSVTVKASIQDRFSKSEVYYLGLSHTGIVRWTRSTNAFSLIEYPEGGAAETSWIRQPNDSTLVMGTTRWDYKRPGVFVYNLRRGRFIHTPTTQLVNNEFSVPFFRYGEFDKQGRFWIGNADEGIRVFNWDEGREVTPLSDDQQKKLFHNNSITDLLVTKKGQVLIGTKEGIMRTDEVRKMFVNLDNNIHDSINYRAVNSLLEDKQGNIWAARWGCLTQSSPDGRLLKIFTSKDGFHDQEINGLCEDDRGNIWCGNYEGLYCINPFTRQLVRFTVSDGLISNNTVGRVFMSNDRKSLIVGHRNGFNVVNLLKLLAPAQSPTLAISAFKVHEVLRDPDFTKPILVKREENSFSVDFVALNYRKEQDNQYAYYLEGFDKDWVHSGTRHVAYYTNLSPGEYTLHLRAGDSFKNWNNKAIKLRILIPPAFYETIWFRICMLLLIVGLLFAIYFFRVNQLLRLQKIRNRISADLHDELGSSLSSISILGTLAQKNLSEKHPSAHFLTRMVEEAHEISGSLDDIIWSISPKNDALSSMLARMTRYASEVFEAKRIVYEVVMPENIEEITLSMDCRRNLYLIFKESVNNVVKHSFCTHATVKASLTGTEFVLEIKDNGVGFVAPLENDRNGLVNLSARAKNLKGSIEIQSSPGEGTTVKLVFPLQTRHPKGLLKN